MARQVRLFLIRHGETVDNVAQLYAGSRDSELTNHGYQQATRLGQHFKTLGLSFTHIFSSHLQRAAKTAGLIRAAQTPSAADDAEKRTVPDVLQLPVLMEQDFGFYEGKKWNERPADSKLTGKEHHRQLHKDDENFVDIESRESMGLRVDSFLDGHLLPLLHDKATTTDHVVAVVSHGIILSVLWKRLLLRLPPRSVALSPELAATARTSLEHLGGWSNTGYLELLLTQVPPQESDPPADVQPLSAPPPHAADVAGTVSDTTVSPAQTSQPAMDGVAVLKEVLPASTTQAAVVAGEPRSSKIAHGWTTLVQTINGRDHLKGLKRTGGGVGSSRHDSSQKNIDSFFKRRKIG